MKRREVSWQRLFEAAKAAPVATPEPMPGHLKTRILAHWRAGSGAEDSWLMLGVVCRRALLCAALLMALSAAWSYRGMKSNSVSDVAIANYELRASVMP